MPGSKPASSRRISFHAVFEAAELLNVLVETGAEIFPDRQTGRLTEGFESNFLVMDQDPTEDIRHVGEIALRVKQGLLLD